MARVFSRTGKYGVGLEARELGDRFRTSAKIDLAVGRSFEFSLVAEPASSVLIRY